MYLKDRVLAQDLRLSSYMKEVGSPETLRLWIILYCHPKLICINIEQERTCYLLCCGQGT